MHTHKLLHLDIKPSNLYIRLDGSPVLIDFGAARQTLTQEESKLQPMYTPGFAAPEQYHNRERLGPWTDIYSVGASMYACLAGYPPQAADARLLNDKLMPATLNLGGTIFRPVAGNRSTSASSSTTWSGRKVCSSLQKVLMDRTALTPPQVVRCLTASRSLNKNCSNCSKVSP